MMILQKTRSVNNLFEIHGIDGSDSLQIEMIRNNSFAYLADSRFREMDGELIMLCKLDGMSIMSKLLQRGSLEVREILGFLSDLAACITEMKEYLLKPENLIIDANYILFDNRSGHYRFILVPGEYRDFSQQLRSLMEELLSVMDHSDHEAAMFIYSFFSGNVLRDNFTPESFLGIMQGADGYSMGGRFETGGYTAVSCMCGQAETERETAGVNGDCLLSSETIKVKPTQAVDEDRGAVTHKSNEAEKINNIGMYCVGGVIAAVGVMIAITYGLSGLKIVMAVAVVYIAVLINRILKTREEEKLEEDMRVYSAGEEPVNFVRDVENIFASKGCETELYPVKYGTEVYSSGGYDSGLDTAFMVQEPAQQAVEEKVTRLVPVDLSLIGMEGQILLTGDRLVVGRTSEVVDYCLAVPGISRRHAEIVRNGSGYYINDLNSTNGTYVNSVRITAPTWLNYGDIVSFATVDFYCM
ncbi:MAG: FHA domain-containing protein [Eubacterium sp.]|nr:FHA domain-containing protein [Eubacterium sp.]